MKRGGLEGRDNTADSPWLLAWDEIDRAWSGLERALLLMVFFGLLMVMVLRFGYAAAGVTPPALLTELPSGLMILTVLLAASAGVSRLDQALPDCRLLQRPAWAGMVCLVTSLVCLLLAAAGLRYLVFDLHLGSAPILGLPGWWPIALVPLFFLVIALRLLRRSLQPTVDSP